MGILKPGVNDAATTDPERSRLMFADFEVAKTVSRNSSKKAWFACPKQVGHPNWLAAVQSVIAVGTGCPTCTGNRCVTGINDAATTDPERSKMFADPDVAKTVSRNSNKKARFACPDDAAHHRCPRPSTSWTRRRTSCSASPAI